MFIATFLIISTFACDDDESNEASEAFKNCAASSQATIYRLIGEEKDEDRPDKMCTILNGLYSGCNAQKLALETCRGASHVTNLIQTRLYAMQYTLDLTYSHQNIDVASCEVFNPPEAAKPDPPKMTLNPKMKANHRSSEGVMNNNGHGASDSYVVVPKSLLSYLIVLISLWAYV